MKRPTLHASFLSNSRSDFESISEYDQEVAKRGSENFDIFFRSESQEHDFNFPFQIGTFGDPPEQAKEFKIPLKEGDLVILGTDGVFDNLYDFEILDVVEEYWKGGNFNGNELADLISKKAFDNSQDHTFYSPFCRSKLEQKGFSCIGGKADDITVALGRVDLQN